MGITLLELGLIKKHAGHEEKQKIHAIFVAIFLVVAHIAMVFGMLDPELTTSAPMIEEEHVHMQM